GKTVGENIEGSYIKDTNSIRPIDNPYSKTGGIAILWGNIAKDGCVVKRSAVSAEMLVHTGPARVFDSEDTAIDAIYNGEI
ncbi:MAG: dihydroxy-acid dehydratase, partial [Oscillospiraceae bacterium]